MKGLVIIVLLLAAPGLARGDNASDALTVLPWTDASLVFSDKDKRGSVSFAHLMDSGLSLHLRASAPLNEDTRLAALTENNRLVGGFAGSVAIGWDTRGAYLSMLTTRVEEVTRALEMLETLPDWTGSGAQAAFAASNPPGPAPGSMEQIVIQLCSQLKLAGCSPTSWLTEMCLAFSTPENRASCPTKEMFFARAVDYWRSNDCARTRPVTHACAAAGLGTWYLQMSEAYGMAQLFLGNRKLLEDVVRIYKEVDDKATEKLDSCHRGGTTLAQCVALHAADIQAAFNRVRRTAPLEQRDILLSAVHARKVWGIAIIFSASLSYDRVKVYEADIASAAKDAVAYELDLGPDFTAYAPVEGLSFHAKVGLTRSRDTGAAPFERCAAVTSSNANVTGTRCNGSALFRTGPAPDATTAGFARVAVDYQYRGRVSNDQLTPGVELRAGIDGIKQDKTAHLRLTLFGTPVRGTAAARVGVALDVGYAINHDGAAEDTRWTVTPLIFVGATLTDILSH